MGRILSSWLVVTLIPWFTVFIVSIIMDFFIGASAEPNPSPSLTPSVLMLLVLMFVSNIACYAISIRYIILGYSPGILRLICGWLATYGIAIIILFGAGFLWMGLFKPWTGVSSIREHGPLDEWVYIGSLVFGSLVGFGLSTRYIINR